MPVSQHQDLTSIGLWPLVGIDPGSNPNTLAIKNGCQTDQREFFLLGWLVGWLVGHGISFGP